MQGVVEELHRPARKNFPRRHVIVKSLNDLFQADVCDLQNYSRSNKGYKYILTVINVFSKYAWCIPLKSKTADEVTKAFATILKKKSNVPKNLQVDQATEFFNAKFQDLMKKYKINLYHTYSVLKASVVERFNRTLKNKLWKIFSLQGNYRYIDILPKVTNEYNNTIHSTIKMKPKDVSKKHEKTLLESVYNYKNDNKKFKFKINDPVRISKYKHLFEKGYKPNWTTEIFTIKRRLPTYPATYLLQDYLKDDIKGAFYEYELQKTKYPKDFLIEKVLKRRGKNEFVKWLGFDSRHNSWINVK